VDVSLCPYDSSPNILCCGVSQLQFRPCYCDVTFTKMAVSHVYTRRREKLKSYNVTFTLRVCFTAIHRNCLTYKNLSITMSH
jgi:hypothetical protein